MGRVSSTRAMRLLSSAHPSTNCHGQGCDLSGSAQETSPHAQGFRRREFYRQLASTVSTGVANRFA